MHEEGSNCEEEEEIVENGGMWKLRSPSKKKREPYGRLLYKDKRILRMNA